MDNIIALVLTAGDSTRMWPLEDKNFITFLNKPLIYYSINRLYQSGIREFIIIANKNNHEKFNLLNSFFPKAKITVVIQKYKGGMAGAVLSVKKIIMGKSILIIGPSDVFEDILLSKFSDLLFTNPDGIITGITMKSYFPGGYLKVKDDKLQGIIEKPLPNQTPSNIVTLVFDYFRNASGLLQAIEKIGLKNDDVFERALDMMVKEGFKMKLLRYNSFWGYLKFPWHVLNINEYFLHKIKKQTGDNTEVDETVSITGEVFLGNNVRVLANTKIVGPSYIGDGTTIGNNSLIRASMVGENCVIGFGTEIARSYIGRNCWFHSNYIGDSILADNISMGAGAVLANFRLDEGEIKSQVNKKTEYTGKIKLGSMVGDNVRIGVNASIMPGIKLGKNCAVGSGVVLMKDLENNKYCYQKDSNYKVVTNKSSLTDSNRKDLKEKLKF